MPLSTDYTFSRVQSTRHMLHLQALFKRCNRWVRRVFMCFQQIEGLPGDAHIPSGSTVPDPLLVQHVRMCAWKFSHAVSCMFYARQTPQDIG